MLKSKVVREELCEQKNWTLEEEVKESKDEEVMGEKEMNN